VALDEPRGRLYVLTRFDNALSVVDLAARREVQHLPLFNPEPASVRDGRRFLYDARKTSGHGDAACASCHVFGDLDGLAWDLGDPDGDVTQSPLPIIANPANVPPDINGTGEIDDFHPMKGPMTTQTLRGLANHGAMHWRGDRATGALGTAAFDEDLSFRNFIVAFSGLLGRDGDLSEADMQKFADFALALRLPPNPVRALDNQLTPAQQTARDFFLNTPTDGALTCAACHGLDPSQGFFGANGNASFEGSPQIFKVPHLRNLYQKVGMFGFLANFGGGIAFTGEQVRGYGYNHSGAIDTLFRFVSAPVFDFPDEASRRGMEQFMLAFDTDLPPISGQQVTLTQSNAADAGPRIDLLIARAAAPFTSQILGGEVRECDLVARVGDPDAPRGFLYEPGTALFEPDDGGAGISDPALRDEALAGGRPVTYTCAPPGSGRRIGLDRDEDALGNGVETGTGVFVDASDTGTRADAADSDGDGFGDGVEVAAGSDPNDPFDFPGLAAVPVLPAPGLGLLAAALLGVGMRGASRR
jgi:hypothetical protein